MALYGMGLTQHVAGVENVQMLVNLLLLLRGNIGKAGAGLCAIRGHSNVQGQRAVRGFRVVIYDIPSGCVGAYVPEANPLVPPVPA